MTGNRNLFTIIIITFFITAGIFPIFAGRVYQYDPKSISFKEIWVNPSTGNDSNNGNTRNSAVKTLDVAWGRVPMGKTSGGCGFRINLCAGDYKGSALIPNGWMEGRKGTEKCPIVIESADGEGRAKMFGNLNIYDCSYLYLIGISIVPEGPSSEGGNIIHIEKGDHILLRSCRLKGSYNNTNLVQETLKINQSRNIYVEHCDISGAYWFCVDFVSVYQGRLTGNKIYNSGDDAVVLKGGTSSIIFEDNEVFDSGNIGIAIGQGTGFEFMTCPWINYEAYYIRCINNVVRNTQNSGLAVRGGFNILAAYNTFYQIALDSERGGSLLLIALGSRSCDGNTALAKKNQALNGWGPVSGDAGECIPNKNVFIYNNIFFNPEPVMTKWSHIEVFGPRDAPRGTNIPSPVHCDDNLRISGNVIWNGTANHPLGIEEEDRGCRPSNPTCNESILRSSNYINTIKPEFTNPATGDFHPVPGGSLSAVNAQSIPDFQPCGKIAGISIPAVDSGNTVTEDYEGRKRQNNDPPGALIY